jgi:hypothetical protein
MLAIGGESPARRMTVPAIEVSEKEKLFSNIKAKPVT